MAFAHAVHVKRMIEGIAVQPKQTFWVMTINLLMESAAIEWSKVFGSRNQQTHWTQVLEKEEQTTVRDGLLQITGMKLAEWKAYRDTIVSYRNQMVAHHDLDAAVAAYPQFDPALLAANFMFDQLRARADQDWLGGMPIDLDRWGRRVARNMTPIVWKAFQASAELGSNVRGG